MIISWQGKENFILKAKSLSVTLGEKIKLGEMDITEPGEYEVGGVQIEVIDGICQVYLEGMNIGHIKKAHVMTDEELEKLNGIDILIIGVGGGDFTETKTAINVISQIDPSVVIPMAAESVTEFTKEEGASVEGQDELKINKAELPVDSRQVVVLNVRN